jgi:AcrR family transcriptional regulator
MSWKKDQTRKQIMDAAYILFRKHGFTRVSVDQVAETAGITKRTLYSHFESKDALLTAVLETQHAMAFSAFQTFGRKLSGTPREIVAAYFKELMRWSSKPKFPGSGFTRLAMELADLPGHPARKIASMHKRMMEAHLAQAFADAGLLDAKTYARQVWLLSEGAIALIFIHGDKSYCSAAEEAALLLISTR